MNASGIEVHLAWCTLLVKLVKLSRRKMYACGIEVHLRNVAR